MSSDQGIVSANSTGKKYSVTAKHHSTIRIGYLFSTIPEGSRVIPSYRVSNPCRFLSQQGFHNVPQCCMASPQPFLRPLLGTQRLNLPTESAPSFHGQVFPATGADPPHPGILCIVLGQCWGPRLGACSIQD